MRIVLYFCLSGFMEEWNWPTSESKAPTSLHFLLLSFERKTLITGWEFNTYDFANHEFPTNQLAIAYHSARYKNKAVQSKAHFLLTLSHSVCSCLQMAKQESVRSAPTPPPSSASACKSATNSSKCFLENFSLTSVNTEDNVSISNDLKGWPPRLMLFCSWTWCQFSNYNNGQNGLRTCDFGEETIDHRVNPTISIQKFPL